MTLSALSRLRALPTIVLALGLSVALAGCSSSEPAETTEPKPAAETTAEPEAPAETEPQAAETEAPVRQDDQLIGTITIYTDGQEETSTATLSYDEAGRPTSYESDGLYATEYSYNEDGSLVSIHQTMDQSFSDVKWSYNADGLPTEVAYDDNEPQMYQDPETGELSDDPSVGEPAVFTKNVTHEWNAEGTQDTETNYGTNGEAGTVIVSTYETTPSKPIVSVSFDPVTFSQPVEKNALKPVTAAQLDANGNEQATTTYEYNAAGDITSATTSMFGETSVDAHEYDAQGNETLQTMTYGEETVTILSNEWTYDESNNPIKLVSDQPDFGLTTYMFYTYDSAGRLKAKVTAQKQEDGSLSPFTCEVFSYLAGDEELTVTPQELMDAAKAELNA